jgi:hypothetical protein
MFFGELKGIYNQLVTLNSVVFGDFFWRINL